MVRPIRPIAVLSFDRPHYLEAVLRSLKAQTEPISSDEVVLFQDGYRSKNGRDITDPRLVKRCVELFETIFPGSKIFGSTHNLGVAWNFARAESHLFGELGAEAAFFFEDDLVLSPHYLVVLEALTEIALMEKRIAYVAAYGNHRASLIEQKREPNKLIPLRHKWGFATTYRQWVAQREIMEPYLEIVSRKDYSARDHKAIQEYFRKLGYGSTGSSQDGMKDVASCVLGTTKVMTFACFGRYIGEVGLHSKKQIYDEEGFGKTEVYPDEILSFVLPSSDELENWIAIGRMHGKRALEPATMMGRNRITPPAVDTTRTPAGSQKKRAVLPLAPADRESVFSEEAFARALYEVFLFREPDPEGFASAMKQLRSGRTVEELLIWCLRSPEFAAKLQRFMETYVGPRAAAAPGQVPVPLRYVPLDAPAMRVECHASPSELAELIHRVGEAWTSMGSTRPYHSVLTVENLLPDNINSEAIDAFWASGSNESTRLQSMLMSHDFDSTESKICVEYGCGVGRVTSPLARMFKEVYAYDVSSTHLEIARARAEFTNIEFVLCTHNIFRTGLQKCDFFYSNIVLQHNPPPLIQKLISIALEALRPGGIAIFQVPTYASGYSFSIREYLDRQKHHDMEMHVFPQPEIFALIIAASCELKEVREDGNIGRVGQWISNTFVVRRPRSAVGFESGKHGA
jgi:2-polyprenyl-3-methyl-5-hydroxy-6-metoxy-1,4-benzoquinol methylase